MSTTGTETVGKALNRIASEMSRALTQECGVALKVLLATGCEHDFVVIANDVAALDRAIGFFRFGGFTVLSIEHDVWANDPDFAGEPAEHWAFVKGPVES